MKEQKDIGIKDNKGTAIRTFDIVKAKERIVIKDLTWIKEEEIEPTEMLFLVREQKHCNQFFPLTTGEWYKKEPIWVHEIDEINGTLIVTVERIGFKKRYILTYTGFEVIGNAIDNHTMVGDILNKI